MAPLVVTAATGAAALVLLVLMLSSAPMLVRIGLTGHVWYVLLLLLGLLAAVTVFSLFKSYARYSGKALGLDDDTYELVKPELTIRLNQDAVYAAIQPKQLQLVGYVSDA